MMLRPLAGTAPVVIAALAMIHLLTALPYAALAQEGLVPEEVSTVQLGHGWRFTDGNGMTLYHYESDQKEPGTSSCTDACAAKHPPLLAATENPEGLPNWSVITRPEGSRQWAYNDMPVYTFARDAYAGATFGEESAWRVAFQAMITPSGLATFKSVAGHVLASADGMTLYVRKEESPSEPGCNAECLEVWPPALAPWVASGIDAFTIVDRTDGLYQWAYKGQSLHLYARDSKPGDLSGDGADDLWAAMIVEPAPPMPSWVRVVGSDAGELLADSDGMTLYVLNEDSNAAEATHLGSEECFGDCIAANWSAVQPQSLAPPVGNWSTKVNEDQSLQWTYRGRPLFTSKLETKPGDLSGILPRSHMSWRPIMYRIPTIQGTAFRPY
tara:strand:- start:1584 stop:2735 length:1152 start_codon:yes stop_codon:yes gene_type:complete